MVMALLEKLDVPKDSTICETIAAQAASDFNTGAIDVMGVKMFLTVDATDPQGQHEHKVLEGPDFEMIKEETALALLKILEDL